MGKKLWKVFWTTSAILGLVALADLALVSAFDFDIVTRLVGLLPSTFSILDSIIKVTAGVLGFAYVFRKLI